MLYVADEGTGVPVVLLHAYPCDHTMWDPQAAALVSAGYRVVRPDLPGFGESLLPPGAPHSLTVMSDAVFAALDQRGIGAFVLGGLSMGGYVAMQMLRQRPDRIAALVLVDTKATSDGPEARAVREQTAQKALASGSLAPLAEGMLPGLLGGTTMQARPAAVERTMQWITAAPSASAAWAMRAMADRPDSLATLSEFAGPAVVVAGAEDVLSPRAEQDLMVEALPNVRFVEIAQCGHLSAVERPEALSAALQAFLAEVQPAIG
jgi:pimeloyl-ACP methyl ester carboxylesterase